MFLILKVIHNYKNGNNLSVRCRVNAEDAVKFYIVKKFVRRLFEALCAYFFYKLLIDIMTISVTVIVSPGCRKVLLKIFFSFSLS